MNRPPNIALIRTGDTLRPLDTIVAIDAYYLLEGSDIRYATVETEHGDTHEVPLAQIGAFPLAQPETVAA